MVELSKDSAASSLKGVKLLHKEIKQLIAKPVEGIEVSPNEADLFTLCAVVAGPGKFLTSIFHPNISPTTGEICLSTLQKDWQPELGLAHLLLVAPLCVTY
ncbi:hypothetical protein PSACC_01951 [Paramicrosporidium saccamoebae]|uniref:UBC core domain-containing protein n=1 Tax=Paramicrosporidium saccamoebae TaxID=1246581 RepID=A0A2H9TKJ5_9FUNG|nr:hypothetical protein PSACC_01951 [Paramicrosporidium saccamoebae]